MSSQASAFAKLSIEINSNITNTHILAIVQHSRKEHVSVRTGSFKMPRKFHPVVKLNKNTQALATAVYIKAEATISRGTYELPAQVPAP